MNGHKVSFQITKLYSFNDDPNYVSVTKIDVYKSNIWRLALILKYVFKSKVKPISCIVLDKICKHEHLGKLASVDFSFPVFITF